MVDSEKVWVVFVSDSPALSHSMNEAVFSVCEMSVLKVLKMEDGFYFVLSDSKKCTFNYTHRDIDLIYSSKEEALSYVRDLITKRIEKMREDARAYERSIDLLDIGKVMVNFDGTYVMGI
jgi:hypothetical protein